MEKVGELQLKKMFRFSRNVYSGCEKFFLRGFRCRPCLYCNVRAEKLSLLQTIAQKIDSCQSLRKDQSEPVTFFLPPQYPGHHADIF